MEGLLDCSTYKSGWKPVIQEKGLYNNEDYEKNNLNNQENTDSKIAKLENHVNVDNRKEYYSIMDIQKAARVYESQLKDIMNKLNDINNNINSLHDIISNSAGIKDSGTSMKKYKRFLNLK